MTRRKKTLGSRQLSRVSLILLAFFAAFSIAPLPADDVKLENFPRGKWLDVTWQAYWTFGDDTIKLLDVHDAEIYDFAGIVQNMKVTNLPKGGVRLTFDCEQAHRSYLFEKAGPASPMQMVIRQKGSSIAYRMAMPPVSDTQLTDYKAAVIAEKPAEVAKIVASIQDIPSSAKAAQRAEQAKTQTATMLEVAATADFQKLETLSVEVEKQGLLDAMIQTLEAEAAKPDAPPAVFISLSVLYGRKNLKTQSYAALELAEKAPVPPNVNLNVSLLYGRKKLMAGAPDANTFMVGDIEILSVPDAVPVFLDGVEKGKGSMTLSKVPAGTHVITCEHPDYQPFSVDLELGVGQNRQVVANIVMKQCLLSITPYIRNCKVFIDGFEYPNRDLIIISPGDHEVEVHVLNKNPVKETVKGIPGETTVMNWVRGNPWDITTYPEGATVSINGQIIGVTPLKDISVLAMTQTVICEWPGKAPVTYTQDFFLTNEETKGFLILTQPFVIPTKTIKIDGKNDDWTDIEEAKNASHSMYDNKPDLPGILLAKALICQDKKYVYWYMEFSDGMPLYSTGCGYSVRFKPDSPDNPKYLELKLKNTKGEGSISRTWKPMIPSNLLSSDNVSTDMWNDSGKSSDFKVGSNFIEARFPRSVIFKALDENAPVFLDVNASIEQLMKGMEMAFGEVYFKR